jgi:hypothetical protein
LIRIGSWITSFIRLPKLRECGKGVDVFPDVAAALHIRLEARVGYDTPTLKAFEDLPVDRGAEAHACGLRVASVTS